MSRVSRAVVDFDSQYVRPLVDEAHRIASQAHYVIAELRPLAHRANTIVSGVELRTRRAMMAVDAVNDQLEGLVHTGLSRVRAIERGFRRGVEALVNSTHR